MTGFEIALVVVVSIAAVATAGTVGVQSYSLLRLKEEKNEGQKKEEQDKNEQEESETLAVLNAAYELQLKEGAERLKTTQALHDQLEERLSKLNMNLIDTRIYRNEISQLAANLAALNAVYGDLLKGMAQKQKGKGEDLSGSKS